MANNGGLVYDLAKNDLEELKSLPKGTPIIIKYNGGTINAKYRGLDETDDENPWLLCGGAGRFNLSALRGLEGGSLKVYKKKRIR